MNPVSTAKATSQKTFSVNRRRKTLVILMLVLFVLATITLTGAMMDESRLEADFSQKNQGPSARHLFGTDYMGRDMLARTLKGLSTSILIGLSAATVSAVIALLLGLSAALLGKWVDELIAVGINMVMGIPHILLLMLISFVVGRGVKGVVIAVILTHWPSLTRIIRAEVLQLKNAQYVKASAKLGKGPWWIARKHMLPHLISQFAVGLILMFPHAILHEASITFLGFGLPIQMPAIGIILSESMKYLSMGMWWLAFFPGVSLLAIILLFDALGENLRLLVDPHHAHE